MWSKDSRANLSKVHRGHRYQSKLLQVLGVLRFLLILANCSYTSIRPPKLAYLPRVWDYGLHWSYSKQEAETKEHWRTKGESRAHKSANPHLLHLTWFHEIARTGQLAFMQQLPLHQQELLTPVASDWNWQMRCLFKLLVEDRKLNKANSIVRAGDIHCNKSTYASLINMMLAWK